MKNLLLTVLCISLTAAVSHAQDLPEFSTTTKLKGELPFLDQNGNILGASFNFDYSGGTNKFDDGNVRKPSDLGVNYAFNYEQIIGNSNVAVGGFLQGGVDIQKDKELDTKYTSHTLVAGPMATYYKPCGKAENAGIFNMLEIGAGFTTNTFKFDDQKESDPISPILTTHYTLGAYYTPTSNVMLTLGIGAFSTETIWMKGDDSGGSSSTPDMVMTEISTGFKDFRWKLGGKYTFGSKAD